MGEDRDGAGGDAFADTGRGTRDGYADKGLVREPAAVGPRELEVLADDWWRDRFGRARLGAALRAAPVGEGHGHRDDLR